MNDLNGQIDFALILAVVHEVDDPTRFFSVVHHTLRPGGRVVFTEPKGHVREHAFRDSLSVPEQLFIACGLYFGMTEGVEKALVADLVPANVRGAAFGWNNLTIGLAAFPASLIFGGLWQAYGAATAFVVGAGLAFVAAVGEVFGAQPRGLEARYTAAKNPYQTPS